MYYEFYNNLDLLNSLSLKEKKIEILVNLHSSHKSLVNDMNHLFPNLKFSSKKIDHLINQSFALISFSSTAIEDAVSSNRFVVLLDQWKRYRHFKGNIYKNFNSIFYVNNKLQLTKTIERLLKQKMKFNFFINPNNVKHNFKKILRN